VSNGLGVHVGLSGIDLHADSLASLALGGILFITPQNEDDGLTGVTDGYVFRLEPDVDKDWLDNAASIPLTELELPRTVAIVGTTHTRFLGISRQQKFKSNGILLKTDEGVALFTANLPTEENEAEPQTPELQIRQDNAEPIVIPAGGRPIAATAVNTIYPESTELSPDMFAG